METKSHNVPQRFKKYHSTNMQAGETAIFVYLRLLDMLGFVPVVALQKCIQGERGSVSPALYRYMPSHSLFCVWSDSDFIFFFIYPPYSVFYSNSANLQKTPAQCLGGCHIPILHLLTKLYSRIRKFCTSTQEKIHRNLRNPRQHFETSKERTQCIWISFITPSWHFFIQPQPYLKGDWLLVTLQ